MNRSKLGSARRISARFVLLSVARCDCHQRSKGRSEVHNVSHSQSHFFQHSALLDIDWPSSIHTRHPQWSQHLPRSPTCSILVLKIHRHSLTSSTRQATSCRSFPTPSCTGTRCGLHSAYSPLVSTPARILSSLASPTTKAMFEFSGHAVSVRFRRRVQRA